jgi:plastocyanin
MKPIMPAAFSIFVGTALLGAAPAAPAVKALPHILKVVQASIANFRFTPNTLTIPVDTQVTWLNNDDVPHTVVSTRALFKSRALDTGDKFSYTFRAKGTYAYFCSVHPMMTAKVIVR